MSRADDEIDFLSGIIAALALARGGQAVLPRAEIDGARDHYRLEISQDPSTGHVEVRVREIYLRLFTGPAVESRHNVTWPGPEGGAPGSEMLSP